MTIKIRKLHLENLYLIAKNGVIIPEKCKPLLAKALIKSATYISDKFKDLSSLFATNQMTTKQFERIKKVALFELGLFFDICTHFFKLRLPENDPLKKAGVHLERTLDIIEALNETNISKQEDDTFVVYYV